MVKCLTRMYTDGRRASMSMMCRMDLCFSMQRVGMTEIARTNRNLHNYVYTSHVLRSGNITFAITSPYLSEPVGIEVTKNKLPNPAFDPQRVSKFITQHGSGVGAMSVRVADVRAAFDIIVANGGTGMCAVPARRNAMARSLLTNERSLRSCSLSRVAIVPPTLVTASEEEGGGSITFAEILVYEDDLEKIPSHMPEYAGLPVYQSNTVLRLIQRDGYSGTQQLLGGRRDNLPPLPLCVVAPSL